ncbi:ribonuclease J [bacterium]|nr:ribonuclease J [bacterium]
MASSSMNSPLRIIPLGGLGEIGMNCLVLEHEEEILVVDCGLMFSDLDHFGVEFVIPDFTYLVERKDKVKGFLITHGHEDHIGALPFALKAGIRAPVFASKFSSLLIRERLTEYGLVDSTDIRVFKMGDVLKFKHFTVQTASVNHSIVDAAALIIDTPMGRVIHTGDFKIDPTPFLESTIDPKPFQKAGEKGVKLLLSDSTNVERHTCSLSEKVIYNKFEQIFSESKGLTMIAMFASNVSRMAQVFDLARKMKKKVVLSGRTMEQNVRLGTESGHLKNVDSLLLAMDDLESHNRKDIIVLSTGSQAEHSSSLVRIANGEHRAIQIMQGDLVVLSSRYIPGNEKAIGKMVNNLFKRGAEVLYEAVQDIHVSGHATRPELKTMLEWTKPEFFVPIHGEYRHLVHHAQLAEEAGVAPENTVIATNGDIIELTQDSCRVVEHMEEPRVLIEGREGNDVTKLVLKERRQLGETGVVFSLMVRNAENGEILSEPEVITKGLTNETLEGWLIDEAKKIVKKAVYDHHQSIINRSPMENDLQETIRLELRRFFKQNIGKKPIVLPIVLDL